MIIVFVALLGIGLLCWNQFYTKRWNRGLDVEILFSCDHVCVGQRFTLTEIISNRKRLPVPVLEIGFRVPTGIRFADAENTTVSDYIYKRDVFSLLGMESITRRYHMEPVARGRYKVSQIVCEAPSLLHFSTSRSEPELPDQELLVYARRVDVSRILLGIEAVLGEMESTRKTYEDPFAFAGIREYTIQDPMKTINWKASARSGGLMVNTYTSMKAMNIRVCLDLEDSGILKYPSLLEESISIAATLCAKLIRQGRQVSLAVNVNPVINNFDGMNPGNPDSAGIISPGNPDSADPISPAARPGSESDFVLLAGNSGEAFHKQLEEFLTQDFTNRKILPFVQMLRHIDKLDDRNIRNAGDRIQVLITKNAAAMAAQIHETLKNTSGTILVVPYKSGMDLPVLDTGLRTILWEETR